MKVNTKYLIKEFRGNKLIQTTIATNLTKAIALSLYKEQYCIIARTKIYSINTLTGEQELLEL